MIRRPHSNIPDALIHVLVGGAEVRGRPNGVNVQGPAVKSRRNVKNPYWQQIFLDVYNVYKPYRVKKGHRIDILVTFFLLVARSRSLCAHWCNTNERSTGAGYSPGILAHHYVSAYK